MSAVLSLRPSAQLRARRALNLEAEHLDHFRQHLNIEKRRLSTAPAEWERGTVPVTLAGPWKNRELSKVLAAWGVPTELHDLEQLAHLRGGGWALFALPPMPDLYAYMAKVAKHPEAIGYLVPLARLAIFSTLTLSEAAALVLDGVRIDPLADSAPGASANEWVMVGLTVIDAWQARRGSTSVGDEVRIAGLLAELKVILADRQIAQLELELAERKAALRGDRA